MLIDNRFRISGYIQSEGYQECSLHDPGGSKRGREIRAEYADTSSFEGGGNTSIDGEFVATRSKMDRSTGDLSTR